MSEHIIQRVRKLAKDATPTSYEDEGSERQVKADWKLWGYMERHCTKKEIEKLGGEIEGWKMTADETYEECVKFFEKKYKFKNRKSYMNTQERTAKLLERIADSLESLRPLAMTALVNLVSSKTKSTYLWLLLEPL